MSKLIYRIKLWLASLQPVTELRISKNCRWTSNFTPPTESYTSNSSAGSVKFGTESTSYSGNIDTFTQLVARVDALQVNEFLTKRFLRRE